MTDRLPSMPFFVSDYLANTDVMMMSLAERGLYTHLMFRQWQDGRLEFNAKKLSVLCACSESEFLEIWEGVKEKFNTDSEGRIYNKRVETVKKEYLRIRKKRSISGSKGGSKTASKRASKSVDPLGSKKQPPIHSSPIHSSPIHSDPIKDTASMKPKRESNGTARNVLAHWNKFEALTRHRALSDKTASSINARIKAGYSEADLCQAITRYAEMCQQRKAPGHNNWSLSKLMSGDEGGWIDKMLDPSYEGIVHDVRETPGERRNRRNLEAYERITGQSNSKLPDSSLLDS